MCIPMPLAKYIQSLWLFQPSMTHTCTDQLQTVMYRYSQVIFSFHDLGQFLFPFGLWGFMFTGYTIVNVKSLVILIYHTLFFFYFCYFHLQILYIWLKGENILISNRQNTVCSIYYWKTFFSLDLMYSIGRENIFNFK